MNNLRKIKTEPAQQQEPPARNYAIMSLIDVARDTLKDLPVSDLIRGRLSLALDRLAESDAKIEILQSENAALKVELERERLDHQKTQQDLQRLKDDTFEEIRIHRSIEFRRSNRTGGKWMAFCPNCHMPAGDGKGIGGRPLAYCTMNCGWSVYPPMSVAKIIPELEVRPDARQRPPCSTARPPVTL